MVVWPKNLLATKRAYSKGKGGTLEVFMRYGGKVYEVRECLHEGEKL